MQGESTEDSQLKTKKEICMCEHILHNIILKYFITTLKTQFQWTADCRLKLYQTSQGILCTAIMKGFNLSV